ncbi:MAG: Rpn family recombination-promoting nuclease/putative transposase [Puniceicoccales bacterium]|nr:Rpn family recombination-promoting nuclease/putative transposase [Puniceicoccales bacterium]
MNSETRSLSTPDDTGGGAPIPASAPAAKPRKKAKTASATAEAAARAAARVAARIRRDSSVEMLTNGRPRYIDPTLDYGFKRIFGQEANKDLLLDFLNSILPEDHQIASLTFSNNERLGKTFYEKDAVFDLYCVTPTGEHFIVEMQRVSEKHFLKRVVAYVCDAIRAQLPLGKKKVRKADAYDFAPVYFVGILDFLYDGIDAKGNVRWFKKELLIRNLGLYDENGEPVADTMKYTLVQMPRFTKTEAELKTQTDKWLYFLKNLDSFARIPVVLREPIFEKAFEAAEVATLSPGEYQDYFNDLDRVLLNEAIHAQGIEAVEAAEAAAAEAAAKLAEAEAKTTEAIAETAAKLAEADAKAAEAATKLAEADAKAAETAAKLAEAAAKAAEAAAKLAEAQAKTAEAEAAATTRLTTAKREMARQMKSKGLSAADIAEITGLNVTDINTL